MRETLLVGRVLFSLIFIYAGFGHFAPATIEFAASQGVPFAGLLVPASGLLAIVGGFSILVGYRAKVGAWALVAFLVPVTLTMHAFWMATDPAVYQLQQIMFLKNLSMLGGALTFAYFGAGAYSFDASRETRGESVGQRTSLAGTVIPNSLRSETEAEIAARAANGTRDSAVRGLW